jgi:hypothetical protein
MRTRTDRRGRLQLMQPMMVMADQSAADQRSMRPRLLAQRQYLLHGLWRGGSKFWTHISRTLLVVLAGRTGRAGRAQRGRRMALANGGRRSSARLTLQRQHVQLVLVLDHLHVVQVGLDAPHHLRLLKHLLWVRRGLRLLAPLHRRLAVVVAARSARHRHLVQSHHRRTGRLALQLQHRHQVVGRRTHLDQVANLLGDHAQLLKVDQLLDARIVAQMDEGQVLLDHRIERNDRMVAVQLGGDHLPVLGHVARRVHQVLEVAEQLLVFGGQLLPREPQSRNGRMAQPRNDREQRIEVFALFAVARHFDELLDDFGAAHNVGLGAHLRHHPEHLLVDQLGELLQLGRAILALAFQLEQVVYVLGRFDFAEDAKVLEEEKWELEKNRIPKVYFDCSETIKNRKNGKVHIRKHVISLL